MRNCLNFTSYQFCSVAICQQKCGFSQFLTIVCASRPDDTAGCSGHGSREEVAGDGHQRGEPERREEGRSIPLSVPGSGEQEGEEGDPGL